MAQRDNLYRRPSGICVLRITVPVRYRALIGQREIHASTRTTHLANARAIAARLLGRWYASLEEFRQVDKEKIRGNAQLLTGTGKISLSLFCLCFVEIKTNTTGLLANTPYRSGCWAPSSELSGAMAQIQGTISYAMDSIKRNLNLTDSYGDPTGDGLLNFNPKLILVVGNLSHFSSYNGINYDKLRSFENFRRNFIRPEVITFDELYERARFIVVFSENI